jgi:hypothetical protein
LRRQRRPRERDPKQEGEPDLSSQSAEGATADLSRQSAEGATAEVWAHVSSPNKTHYLAFFLA